MCKEDDRNEKTREEGPGKLLDRQRGVAEKRAHGNRYNHEEEAETGPIPDDDPTGSHCFPNEAKIINKRCGQPGKDIEIPTLEGHGPGHQLMLSQGE